MMARVSEGFKGLSTDKLGKKDGAFSGIPSFLLCPAFERAVVTRRRRFVWPIGGFDRFDGMNGKNGKYRRQFRKFRERFLPCSRRTGDDGFAVARPEFVT